MIGYISLVRDSGKRAWMRADEIAAFGENETKDSRTGKMVPCLTVLLRNNVSWHFPDVSGDDLRKLMASCCGSQVNVIDETAVG